MPEATTYNNAPITEAIIELRVKLPEGASVERLADVHTHIRERYPAREEIRSGAVKIEAGPAMNIRVDASQELNGFRFRSADQLRVFQASLTTATFNRLAPYRSWHEFRDEARGLWAIYKDICTPISVTRAAIRYINRIDIPQAVVDFDDYLRTSPQLSPDLHQGLSGFFMQLQSPQPDIDCMMIITEALVPPPTPEVVSVLLDFDLFREQTWPIEDDEQVWALLEDLRKRKNEAFEASITDATRRLFN